MILLCVLNEATVVVRSGIKQSSIVRNDKVPYTDCYDYLQIAIAYLSN